MGGIVRQAMNQQAVQNVIKELDKVNKELENGARPVYYPARRTDVAAL
ncbi:MAG: hypothetical protein WC208_04255 [Gallionella sp.]|jgi:hypothetical protein